MDFFLDTAKIEEIRTAVDWGLCDGVTTNPSLIAKAGKSLSRVVQEIVQVVDGPISVEVLSKTCDRMIEEAIHLSSIHKNIVVKIPMTKEGVKATRICAKKSVRVNMTLVFTPIQALIAAKAGAAYVSPFIGRLDDIASSGMEIVPDIVDILQCYQFPTRVIVASVRHPMHVLNAARVGAQVCTIPFAVLEKLFNHPLTDIGIRRFEEDWKKVPKG